MLNDSTHNFNPEHFNEELYQEFRRSDYFNYTKFLEDKALEVEQARHNEKVARERVTELEDELEKVREEFDGEATDRQTTRRELDIVIQQLKETYSSM